MSQVPISTSSHELPEASIVSDKSVSVRTLGCRLNFFETDGILSVLKKNGYSVRDLDEAPSHVIINTCTVTNRADVKNRNIIRQAIKKNPGSKIWVTGCYAETDRDAIESIPGVFGVIGNSDKSSLAYRIMNEDESSFNSDAKEKERIENLITVPNSKSQEWGLYLDRFSYSDVLPEGHTRAYLKVQDGCNRKCSYCKIPQARGLGVSRNYKEVLDQVKFLQDSGIGEIILTGVNLGWFRNSENEKSFIPLLEDILGVLDYSRLRLSSIEPPDVGKELADLMKHPRFCKFLHIPLQSGSEKILRAMKRTYNPLSFRKRIENVLATNPGIFLGTDVITGFPGEGEVEFQESLSILKDYKFARIHAFPYSVRKGTNAEQMGDSIPKEVKKERVIELIRLSTHNTISYMKANKGRVLEAILESDGNLITDNYIKGRLSKPDTYQSLFPGQFVDVEIQSIQHNTTQEKNTEPSAVFKIRQ